MRSFEIAEALSDRRRVAVTPPRPANSLLGGGVSYRMVCGGDLDEGPNQRSRCGSAPRDDEPARVPVAHRNDDKTAGHTVVVKRELLDGDPAMARRIYRAFVSAKDVAAERYRQGRRLYEVHNMVPWMNALFEQNRDLFADDWFPYGMSANRTAIDAYLRYHHEQGLSPRRWTADELFATELLDS
jgi:hypothetical protein